MRLQRSRFAKDTAILSLGTIVAQIVSIGAMPLLARLYTPADFGVLAVFMSVCSIVGTAITLRYETAILLPKKEDEAIHLAYLSLISSATFGIALALLVWIIPGSIYNYLGIASLGNLAPFSVLVGIMTATIATMTTWLNRQAKYNQMGVSRVIQTGVFIALAMLLAPTETTNGLIAATIIAQLCAIAYFSFLITKPVSKFSWGEIKRVALSHYKAPRYLMPAETLEAISLSIPPILIASFFSKDMAGQFSMAWKVLILPMALLGSAIGQVAYQRFSSVWPDSAGLLRLLKKIWSALALAAILPFTLLLLFGSEIFGYFFGTQWRESGVMASIFAILFFAKFISSPTSPVFFILGLQRYNLNFGIASLCYRGLSIYIGCLMDNIYIGLYFWVASELIAITFYNLIILRMLKPMSMQKG